MIVVWLRASLPGVVGRGSNNAEPVAIQIAAKAGTRHEQKCHRVIAKNNRACEPC